MQFKKEIRQLLTLHTILLWTMLGGLIFVYFIARTQPVDFSVFQVLQVVLLVAALAAYYVGFMHFRKKLNSLVAAELTVAALLNEYAVLYRNKLLFLLLPGIAGLLGFQLTGNWVFYLCALGVLFILAAQRPTVALLMHQLDVRKEDLFQ
jgi:DMSO reductase anchor subunit